MADAGGLHRTPRRDKLYLGDNNREEYIGTKTTLICTGSNAGASGIIVENTTNVVVTLENGGTLTAANTMNTKEIYPVGIYKVVIAATGKAHVLFK